MGNSSFGYQGSTTARRLSSKKKRRGIGHTLTAADIAAMAFLNPYLSTSTPVGTLDPSRTQGLTVGADTLSPPAARPPMIPAAYTKQNIGALASAGGGGGGGGVGGVAAGAGGDLADIPMNEWEGFASRYSGLSGAMLMDQPEIVLRDAMKAMGFNPNEGLMDLMEEYGPDMANLAMMTLGLDPKNLNALDPGNLVNLYAKFTDDMLTPGKGTPDAMAMVQKVLDAPAGSPLDAALKDGTPQQQAYTVNTLIMSAFSSMPPIFQRAIAGMLEDKTSDWLSQKARGKEGYKGFLSDWLQKGGKGILG